MARKLRPLLPGVPFHITARVQWKEALFSGIEDRLVRVITDARRASDASIAAHAVMPNHLHLLVVAGEQPLCALMQPLLRRIALVVQKHTRREGHVFERRYSHTACLDVQHLRNAVAYIHLNAARKGRCTGADDFRWCSHAEYVAVWEAAPELPRTVLVGSMVRLFASDAGEDLAGAVANYRAFLAWRLECDRLTAKSDAPALPPPPWTGGGDSHWHDRFGRLFSQTRPPHPMDLRDFMKAELHELAPDMPFPDLRGGGSSRALIRVRQAVVVRALMAGYSGRRIARFLNISDATISRVKSATRRPES